MSRSRFVPAWPPGTSVARLTGSPAARAWRVVLVAVIALPLGLLQAGCDSGPGEPPEPENQAPTARLSVSSTNVEAGASVSFDASASSDADGTIADYNWELSAPAESEVSLTVSGDHAELTGDVAGEYEVDLTVTDDDGATDGAGVSVRVDMPDPENITLTLEIQAGDGDSLVTTDVTFGGETVATDFAAGEITLAFLEDPGPLCALATDFFEESCLTLKPNHDQSVQLIGQRKVVELEVSVEPEEAEVVVLDRDGREDVQDGSFTAEYRKLSGDRVIDVAADGYESETETVTADADHALAFDLVEIPPQPACSDGDDNDGDGLVDAEDFGCLSPDGVYEPEDDDEGHMIVTHTYFGTGINGKYFVSSDPEHWIGPGGSQHVFEKSIQVAVEFRVAFDVKVSSDQEGESFTERYSCGSSLDDPADINYFDLVPDDGSSGWITVELTGMDRSWFENGTRCTRDLVHEAYVNNDPGDGDDDVVFGTPDRLGVNILSWAYDPDNVPSGNASSATTQSRAGPLESGACQKTDSGEVCRDVVPDWYLPRR